MSSGENIDKLEKNYEIVVVSKSVIDESAEIERLIQRV
jgi:hypothetical protein